MKAHDLVGQVFHHLTVTHRDGSEKGRQARWACVCKCGATTTVAGFNLKSGSVKSCGCWLLEVHKTHGMAGSKIYNIWQHMHRRCYDTRTPAYANYGGRGIKVCKRWFKFENFLKDMGEAPTGRTLDRRKNDGNYTPSNCRWATGREQVTNRRCSRNVFLDGVLTPLVIACETKGVPYARAIKRMQRGQAIESFFGTQHEHAKT